MYDFARLTCAVPRIRVADVSYNLETVKVKYDYAVTAQGDIALFPLMTLTGATIGDLRYQQALLASVAAAATELVCYTAGKETLLVFNIPVAVNGAVISCTVLASDGMVRGMLPTGSDVVPLRPETVFPASLIGFHPVDKGCAPVYSYHGIRFGIPVDDSLLEAERLCRAGAEVLLYPSAYPETVGKSSYRRKKYTTLSSELLCGCCFANAGRGESSTDAVYSGDTLIAFRGHVTENAPMIRSSSLLTSDIDLGQIRHDRMRDARFGKDQAGFTFVDIPSEHDSRADGSLADIRRSPFLPERSLEQAARCTDIFSMQVAALRKRMSVAGGKLVLGVSGGLDSTLALLVCARAAKMEGRSPSDVVAVTLPGFGTTDRTFNNAVALIDALGAEYRCISITGACTGHFSDIGHDINRHDATYENAQARERTQILMDIANMVQGFVVGTGDLSELALGWCTYGGDQMSMYNINSGIPKTMIKEIVSLCVETDMFPGATDILKDILATPISPELLPPDEKGQLLQKTEDLVGPYELNDFFLYYVIRFGFTPGKIYLLACLSFAGVYDKSYILRCLKVFYRRFFSQQFKRSCMPDGPIIGSVCLSPRSSWHMPSDASARLWLEELEKM